MGSKPVDQLLEVIHELPKFVSQSTSILSGATSQYEQALLNLLKKGAELKRSLKEGQDQNKQLDEFEACVHTVHAIGTPYLAGASLGGWSEEEYERILELIDNVRAEEEPA